MNYVSIHTHSFYSLLDGESSPSRLAERAKELNMTALALTDHNHLLGVIDFKQACKEHGLLPIVGCEMYYTMDTAMLNLSADERREIACQKAKEAGIVVDRKKSKKAINEMVKDFAYPTKQYHILFLAKNEIGYKNLVKLQSEASRICTYNDRYLCDNQLIKQYKEGLIMTTACIGSRTAQLVITKRYEEAEKLILEWKNIFGEDFYLEIQPLPDEEQYLTNVFYMEMSKKHNIALIATNDVHYARKEDIDDHDSLLCIGIGSTKNNPERMRYQPEFWLRSYEEMQEAFQKQYELYGEDNEDYLKLCYKALDETNLIEKKITDDINIGAEYSLFPKINVQEGFTPESYLSHICWQRLYQYLKQHKDYNIRTYEARLKEELDVINPKGFAPYMLANQEMMQWCKDNLLPTGPGRGSAAGSLVLLLLGITKLVDPVKEKLLFSRFLTKDRTSLPD